MLVTNADNIRGRLAIKIVIGSEDGLQDWSEKLHASMVKLKMPCLGAMGEVTSLV